MSLEKVLNGESGDVEKELELQQAILDIRLPASYLCEALFIDKYAYAHPHNGVVQMEDWAIKGMYGGVRRLRECCDAYGVNPPSWLEKLGSATVSDEVPRDELIRLFGEVLEYRVGMWVVNFKHWAVGLSTTFDPFSYKEVVKEN